MPFNVILSKMLDFALRADLKENFDDQQLGNEVNGSESVCSTTCYYRGLYDILRIITKILPASKDT